MKVLTIHSFAIHGTASLKAFLSLLGSRVLPVPSLTLTGLTNLPGHQKVAVDLPALLEGSLTLARHRGERLLMYVGYLGDAGQAGQIAALYEAFRNQIEALIVDPVSGDHGRTYVPDPVMAAWPQLLALADWALPNFHELQLYAGTPPGSDPEAVVAAFRVRYPALRLLCTSFPGAAGQLGVRYQGPDGRHTHVHEALLRHYGGTGDVFAAHFLHYHFFQQRPLPAAIAQSAVGTLDIMRRSGAAGSPDLLLPGALE
ncbi:MAG: hypothetical protein D6722_25500 [Bacteroidetes bacterium]|nr:MAG: hypothetical protein D6722_25500 [Bacteroidota bacterium]